MDHPIKEMMEQRRNNVKCGIPSYCSANELVLEAALLRAKANNRPVLIEATANQVNQFGGYTGMMPGDFYSKVMQLAHKVGLSENMVVLGGDHLGPITWQGEPEAIAMKNAEDMVCQYVLAGFSKIHLDTSMKLADDAGDALSVETVARRGVRLYKSAMKAYWELKQEQPDALRPVFIIGSEVPIPGGAQEAEDTLAVTRPEAFEETVRAYQNCFVEAGLPDGFQDVVALVVQPGVEFGDDQVFLYDRQAAAGLCSCLKKYPGLCFEGHSTDYQSPECLRMMVEDGIAILKVGPALTYGLREACFALSMMERELVPENEHAHFEKVLEDAMIQNPVYWKKHYHGNEKQLHIARKYSFSDRARYYIGQPTVVAAMEKLFTNLRKYPIPINMLHQFMPYAYQKIRDGRLQADPKSLALDSIINFMADYEYASM